MVTEEFLTSFSAKTFILSGYDDILINLPEGNENAQIVKVDCVDCIPGLQLDCGDQGLFVIGSTGQFTFEQPISSQSNEDSSISTIKIFGYSATFPNEPIYGAITVYYWYPTATPADVIDNTYVEVISLEGPVCYDISTILFEKIDFYTNNYSGAIGILDQVTLIKTPLIKYEEPVSFNMDYKNYKKIDEEHYMEINANEEYNSDFEYYYYIPNDDNTTIINLSIMPDNFNSYTKTELLENQVLFIALGAQAGADIIKQNGNKNGGQI